jgi:hypothetical protein
MEPRNRKFDLPGEDHKENVRRSSEAQEELEGTSSDYQDETIGEPVLDEEDMEENDITEDDLDDIEWEEPNSER